MTILGIDPGGSGGIAGWTPEVIWAIDMPKTEADIWREFAVGGIDHAFLEEVHSMPGQGISSTFKFGQNYGFLRGCLVAARIPFETVRPVVWQRQFGLLKRPGETNVQKKNRHKQKAQELFPDLKITHATADALLICEYGRRLLAQRGGSDDE